MSDFFAAAAFTAATHSFLPFSLSFSLSLSLSASHWQQLTIVLDELSWNEGREKEREGMHGVAQGTYLGPISAVIEGEKML